MLTLRTTLRRSLLLGLTTVAVTAAAPAASASAAECDKVASPGAGAAQKLYDSLNPGETGCLHGGRYAEHLRVDDGGTSDTNRVVLRSFPGEQAELYGRLYVTDNANFVTFEHLKLNGASTQRTSNER